MSTPSKQVIYPLIVAVLATLVTTAATSLGDNTVDVAVLEERVKNVQQDVKEIKRDVKTITKSLDRERTK